MMLCEWLLIFKDSQPPDMGSILQVQGDLLMDGWCYFCVSNYFITESRWREQKILVMNHD